MHSCHRVLQLSFFNITSGEVHSDKMPLKSILGFIVSRFFGVGVLPKCRVVPSVYQ